MDLVYQILRYYEKGGFTETDDDWLVEFCVLITEKLRKNEIASMEKSRQIYRY